MNLGWIFLFALLSLIGVFSMNAYPASLCLKLESILFGVLCLMNLLTYVFRRSAQ